MKITTKEQEAYVHVRGEINKAINEIRKNNPEIADYLSKHVLYNDETCTVKYTGDNRISMEKLKW